MVNNRCLINSQKASLEAAVAVIHIIKNLSASLSMDQVDALQLSANSSILKILTGLVTCKRTINLGNNNNPCMVVVNRCNNRILIYRVNNNNPWEEDKVEIRKTFHVEMEQIALSLIACSSTTLPKICNNNLNKIDLAQSRIKNRINKPSNNCPLQADLQIRRAPSHRLTIKFKVISVDNLLNHYVTESSANMLIFLRGQTFSSVLCGRNNLFYHRNKLLAHQLLIKETSW